MSSISSSTTSAARAHVAAAVGERELGPERLHLGDVVDDALDLVRRDRLDRADELTRGRVERLELPHRRRFYGVIRLATGMGMATPRTRYARSGDAHIAYQVFGEGEIDLVLVPGFVSNIEHYWQIPNIAALLERLGAFARVVIFDKRGTGLSDPVSDVPPLDQRMDDMHAVMAAAEVERAALYGISEGGPGEPALRRDLSRPGLGARPLRLLPALQRRRRLPVGQDGGRGTGDVRGGRARVGRRAR